MQIIFYSEHSHFVTLQWVIYHSFNAHQGYSKFTCPQARPFPCYKNERGREKEANWGIKVKKKTGRIYDRRIKGSDENTIHKGKSKRNVRPNGWRKRKKRSREKSIKICTGEVARNV